MKLKYPTKSVGALALLLVVIFLLTVTAINIDTRKTAENLCQHNSSFRQNSFCEQKNLFFNEFNEQFGFNFRFKHFLLSDVAFRNIFVPLGYDLDTMYTLSSSISGRCYIDNTTAPDAKYQMCLNDTDRAARSLELYNRRLIVYFSLWLIISTIVTEKLLRLIDKKILKN